MLRRRSKFSKTFRLFRSRHHPFRPRKLRIIRSQFIQQAIVQLVRHLLSGGWPLLEVAALRVLAAAVQ
ncbi:hypothetical protein Y887_09160 [Xanthomonas pisi DSM 18956]|nr:hypothetical protein Y887_09160 [Xanthomonas pisi DSM 18956]